MKKLIVMVALALTTLTMSAQRHSGFAVKAGSGLSSVVGSDANRIRWTFAYKAGISYEMGLAEGFSLIPGVEFITKGFKSKNIDGNVNMSYAQIPIFAAFKIPVSSGVKLAVKVGPYASYGLYGSDIYFYGRGNINVFDSNGGFERFDAGAIAGISIDIPEGSLGVEYSRGLTKLDSHYKAYHQAVGLVVSYKF